MNVALMSLERHGCGTHVVTGRAPGAPAAPPVPGRGGRKPRLAASAPSLLKIP